MIYVGIDIAKLNHFASAISSDDEILLQPFKFTNDYDGFHLLVQKLDSLDSNNIIIGLESTAHYGNNLVEFLVKHNYKVCIINPIQTSAMRKNNIRKTKTDKVDTYIIAKTLMMNPHRYFTQHDLSIMHLKDLGRFRMKLIKKRTQGKIQLTPYVDQAFLELQYFFKSGTHQKSVGCNDSSICTQITQTIELIELMNSQVHDVEFEMELIINSLDSVIMTIPDIGFINGGMILGEIGNITRFSNPSKVLAFSGLDLTVYQSGNFNVSHTKMSKRGSRPLRYALINAAHNVVRNNKTFKDYYEQKISEGKSHYNSLGHCDRKLVRIIYKMLTDNVPFNLD